MEEDLTLDEKNMLTMKLLHYFITEKDYNPIILQGVDNEIWLENLNEDCKVVRIVSGYIHNNEQFDFDRFKTEKILQKIKKKTFSFRLNVLSIFLDLGENISKEDLNKIPNIMDVDAKDEKSLKNNEFINKVFPDLDEKLIYSEKAEELFMKITNDINQHNREDARKVEKVFRIKFPMVTYILLVLNIILYLVPLLFGQRQYFLNLLCTHGPSIRAGQYYRLITGMFMHADFIHLLLNSYSLYILGTQMESFLGKAKFFIIYMLSGILGALFSMIFSGNIASVGASGAIFGLMGAMVYFGYHYRVYLGNVIKSQIIPLILLNLFIGFMIPGIDNACHAGGLLGGLLVTSALGIKDKSTKSDMINGTIISIIFFTFIAYMAFVYTA